MEGVQKRVFRISQYNKEYFMGMLNGDILTTRLVEHALDVNDYSLPTLEKLYKFLYENGFHDSYLVAHGIQKVNEFGIEEYFELPFQRTTVDFLLELTLNEMNGADGQ